LVKRIDVTNSRAISEACGVLEKGGVIVYPTDTLYGFGCDAKNESAIQKINVMKGRVSPMSVLASSKEVALGWLTISSDIDKVKEKLGGATTVIAPVKENIASKVIMGKNHTLGIRIPNHDFCSELSHQYPNPITTTSVNRSGQPSMTNLESIHEEFAHEIDLMIDAGNIHGTGSTIYLYDKGQLKVLRP